MPPAMDEAARAFQARCNFFMGPPDLFAQPRPPAWPPAQVPVPPGLPAAQVGGDPWYIRPRGLWGTRYCHLCGKYCDEDWAGPGSHEASDRHRNRVAAAARNPAWYIAEMNRRERE